MMLFIRLKKVHPKARGITERLCVLTLMLGSAQLNAHPFFEQQELVAGKAFKADLLVTHGCGDSPTIRLVVEVPEEVLSVTPGLKPGWTVETIESDLSENRTVFGMVRTRYTSRLVWSGSRLPSDYYDVFSFIIIPPVGADTLYFPTTQICEEGTDAYTDIPDDSKPGPSHENLAPFLQVIESKSSGVH